MRAASHIARRGRPAALTPFRHISKKRDVPMKKTFAALMAFSFLASPATAHEVWVERDAAGPARIYLGEPADPVPAAGDPEFSKLTAPSLIGADGAKPAALARPANLIGAGVTGTDDGPVTD